MPEADAAETLSFEAAQPDAGKRLDVFLAEQIPDESRSRIQAWATSGRVRVNGNDARASLRLKGGERIEVDPLPAPPLRAEAENIPLDLIYEDEHLAAVNKPSGMTVHLGAGAHSGTLVNALVHHFERNLSGVGGELRPGIVHRLDRLTSGVIIVAKTDQAHRLLSKSFADRNVRKSYRAIVHGRLPPSGPSDAGDKWRPVKADGLWRRRITAKIGRDSRNRVRMAAVVRGREAVSDVRPLKTNERYSDVEVRIHTGRTHQIRVHLSWIGHPVVGDRLYGAPAEPEGLGRVDRFFLHAAELRLRHPFSGEELTFEAPLPPDYEDALTKLGLR
jgi:23S rRNA pseudouridine1911/1915/1917 synthase